MVRTPRSILLLASVLALPVQAPVKYETVLNMKTAKALEKTFGEEAHR